MNLQDLRQIVDYHYWARDRLLDAVDPLTSEQFTRDIVSSFRSVKATLVHTYSAEWVWHSRWRGRSPTSHVASDAVADQGALRAMWREHETQVRDFMDGLGEPDVARVIEYRLFNGAAGASSIGQMVQHVVNHGTYHRGQVVTMLRQLGAAPPASLDLIGFYRERAR